MLFQNFTHNLTLWLFGSGVKILIILAAAFLAVRVCQRLVEKIVRKAVKKIDHEAEEKRENTLVDIIDSAFKVFVWLSAALLVLSEMVVDVAALLAGAGIAGLAIGMGAREVISDFIAGLFILLEDQYRVGERVEVAGVTGTVEEITLRRTIIKDKKGTVFSVPNGQIKITVNKSRTK